MPASSAVRFVYRQSSSATWPGPSSPLVPSGVVSSKGTSETGCLVARSWGPQVGTRNGRNLNQPVSMQCSFRGIRHVVCSSPQLGATHLLVSALPVPAADLVDLAVPHYHDPMACSLGLVVAPVAALAFAGTSCRRLDLAHTVVAVVGVVGLELVVVVVVVAAAAHNRSCCRNHRTAAPAPICPAGHNTHHSTGRSCPGHGRSRNIAGHIVGHSPDAVAAAVPVARVLDRSVAAVAVADSGRIVAADTP
jgi:hypothetical protein